MHYAIFSTLLGAWSGGAIKYSLSDDRQTTIERANKMGKTPFHTHVVCEVDHIELQPVYPVWSHAKPVYETL